jgi:hypothetical protein
MPDIRKIVSLIFSMGLILLTVKAQSVFFDDVIIVPATQRLARFDGYSVFLYDEKFKLIQRFSIFDAAQLNVGPHFMAWSPDGERFAVAVSQNINGVAKRVMQLWDLSKATKIYEDTNPSLYGAGASLAWSEEGTEFASIETLGRSFYVAIYNVSDINRITKRHLNDTFAMMDHIAWGGHYLLAKTNLGINIWNAGTGEVVGSATGVDSYALPVFSPNSEEFIFVSKDKPTDIEIWETYPTRFRRRSTLSDTEVWGVGWGEHNIITLHMDGSVRLVDPVSLNVRKTVQGLGYISPFISWNDLKTRFLMTSDTGGSQIRDGSTGELISNISIGTPTSTPIPR